MKTFLLILRVIDGDVYEMPVQARTRAYAQRRMLRFLGVTHADVVWCAA